MSTPITRNLADDYDPYSVNVGGTGHSVKSEIDNSRGKRINDWGPWVALACVLSGISFGMSATMYVEWRTMKTQVFLLDESNQRLKLYLEARGLTAKDLEKRNE